MAYKETVTDFAFDIDPRTNAPRSSLEANVQPALQKLGVQVRFDTFSQFVMFSSEDHRLDGRSSNDKIADLQNRMRIKADFSINDRKLRGELLRLANENSYSSAEETLRDLECETDNTLLQCITPDPDCHEEADAIYLEEVVRIAIDNVVARVFQPGVELPHIPVLFADEGIDLDALLNSLAISPDYWADTIVPRDFKSRRHIFETVKAKTLAPLSMKGISDRFHFENLMNLISATSIMDPDHGDTFDNPAAFIGVIENGEDSLTPGFIHSRQDASCFLPLHLSTIDVEKLENSIDSIFAESVARYDQGPEQFVDNLEISEDAMEIHAKLIQPFVFVRTGYDRRSTGL